MSSREQRAQVLVDQVDDATGRLLSNQLKFVRLASNKNKSMATLAAETTSIEACTSGMIRAVEDLLVISRNLKESWILGQTCHQDYSISEEEAERRKEIVNSLTKAIGSMDKHFR